MSTHGMARPVIPPLTILPTAPETFSVLEQRMRIAEEQAESLMSDLQDLGITNHRFTKCAMSKSADHIRPISPVRARPAFTGDGETLWRNCESLVTRMCHMESMLHTLKLNIFRLHTDRELSTKQSDELEHRLVQMQGEHDQELKDAQLEVMRLRQKLNSAIEQQEREKEAKEKLSAALEIATTTKVLKEFYVCNTGHVTIFPSIERIRGEYSKNILKSAAYPPGLRLPFQSYLMKEGGEMNISSRW
ncbi:hypothetical protein GDO81_007783 [Engystomops pustulosus]|uniref:Uncharacterized protein n=1 Tax=Engystomops pustulosus TaxID=76066 RepID=A0AAV7CAU1_ENGPU|nr:hypothetical protein GDO81_007783 [Engystomops pustulosus]